MRFATVTCALATLLLAAPAAHAGDWDQLDIEAMLHQPNVKLVAIDFFATWCKPCMAAVPKWKKLHQKYRRKGLRFVVVSVQSEGACARPPDWNPDKVICDYDGKIADQWKASDLPQAFLFSWQGNLLVHMGHVEQVEKAIVRYFQDVPRILLEDPLDRRGKKLADGAALKKLIRSELARAAKFDVLADSKEREALRKIRKASYGAGKDEDMRCPLGQEVSPNSLLRTSVVGRGDGQFLVLELLSAEGGCLIASARAPVEGTQYEQPVIEATGKLVRAIVGKVSKPGGRSGKLTKVKRLGEEPEEWEPETKAKTIVKITSTPGGAVVMLDGKLLCQATPCSKAIAQGMHQLSMVMEGDRWEERSERVAVKENAAFHWTLRSRYGSVSVGSTPGGLDVTVDGKKVGITPLEDFELPSGEHDILVVSPCHFDQGKRTLVKTGEHQTINVTLPARQGAVEVLVTDSAGNDLPAAVTVDGVTVGKAPGIFKVSICAKEGMIVHGERVKTFALKVEEKKTSQYQFQFAGNRAAEQPNFATEVVEGDVVTKGVLPSWDFYKIDSNADPQVLQKSIDTLVETLQASEGGPEVPEQLERLAKLCWELSEVLGPDARQRFFNLRAEAIDSLQEVTEKYPKYRFGDRALLSLGSCLVQAGKLEEARRPLANFVRNFPASPLLGDALNLLAEGYYAGNDMETAAKLYQRVEKMEKTIAVPYAWYRGAWCHYNMGDYKTALKKAVSALSVLKVMDAGKEPRVNLLKARTAHIIVSAYSQIGVPANSIEFFLKLSPSGARTWGEHLAEFYEKQGKFDSAVQLYDEMLKHWGKTSHSLIYLLEAAVCNAKTGRDSLVKTRLNILSKKYLRASKKGRPELKQMTPKIKKEMAALVTQYHGEGQRTRNPVTQQTAKEIHDLYRKMFPDAPSLIPQR